MVYIPAVQRRAGCKGFKLNSAKRAFAKAKARERAEKVDTLLDGNAARKNQRFLTALPTLAVPKENIRLKREFSLTAAP